MLLPLGCWWTAKHVPAPNTRMPRRACATPWTAPRGGQPFATGGSVVGGNPPSRTSGRPPCARAYCAGARVRVCTVQVCRCARVMSGCTAMCASALARLRAYQQATLAVGVVLEGLPRGGRRRRKRRRRGKRVAVPMRAKLLPLQKSR